MISLDIRSKMKKFILENDYEALQSFLLESQENIGEVIILTALMGNIKMLDILLKTYPESINYQDFLYKNTALHYVCGDRSIPMSITELLCKYGADISIKNIYGLTPFFCAVIEKQSLSYLSILLKNGADINTTNMFSITPLIYMTTEGTYSQLYFTFMQCFGANPYICTEDGLSSVNIRRLIGDLKT